jgi:hypothetical protein
VGCGALWIMCKRTFRRNVVHAFKFSAIVSTYMGSLRISLRLCGFGICTSGYVAPKWISEQEDCSLLVLGNSIFNEAFEGKHGSNALSRTYLLPGESEPGYKGTIAFSKTHPYFMQ